MKKKPARKAAPKSSPIKPAVKARRAKAGAKRKGPARAVSGVASVKTLNPGLAAAHASRRRAAEQNRQVTALMAQQRRQGMSVPAIAKMHHVSDKTVYARLRGAEVRGHLPRVLAPPGRGAAAPVAMTTAAEVVESSTRSLEAEVAYQRGRIEQLENFLSQIFNVGVKKLLRALAP